MDETMRVLLDEKTYLLIGSTALGPGIFWAWYLYKKETLECEPLRLIVKMFFFGCFAAIPAVYRKGGAGSSDAPLTNRFRVDDAKQSDAESCTRTRVRQRTF